MRHPIKGIRRGTYFRSRMEANFAAYLDYRGIRWEYEKTVFPFAVKRGVKTFTPDFYLPDEDRYIETKGWMDKRSEIQIKRMGVHHPKVKLEVVDWKQYQAIGKEFSSLIADWEFAPDGKSF